MLYRPERIISLKLDEFRAVVGICLYGRDPYRMTFGWGSVADRAFAILLVVGLGGEEGQKWTIFPEMFRVI